MRLIVFAAVAALAGCNAGTSLNGSPSGGSGPSRTTVGPAPADAAALRGSWLLGKAERNGETLPPSQLTGQSLDFSGDDVVAMKFGKALDRKANFLLDTKPAIRTIDITSKDDPNLKILGIYKLEDDRLTLCFVESGDKPRPNDFSTQADSGRVLMVFERKK